MSKANKIFSKLRDPRQEANIDFADLCHLLIKLGYHMRQKGSHHSFTKSGSADFINIQPNGNKAKAYQVRQVRAMIHRN